MRPLLITCLLVALAITTPAGAFGEPLAETLVGTWHCSAREGGSDVAMSLSYRRSDDYLVGEIVEDNGAALLDVWLDDGADEHANSFHQPFRESLTA